jgi:hypothetical protein
MHRDAADCRCGRAGQVKRDPVARRDLKIAQGGRKRQRLIGCSGADKVVRAGMQRGARRKRGARRNFADDCRTGATRADYIVDAPDADNDIRAVSHEKREVGGGDVVVHGDRDEAAIRGAARASHAQTAIAALVNVYGHLVPFKESSLIGSVNESA